MSVPIIPGEQWRPIPGWDGYEVSDHGHLMSYKRREPRLMRFYAMDTGHLRTTLTRSAIDRHTFLIHQLVLLAFRGPCPEGQEIRHLDGDPTNNCLSNLRYGTRSENVCDRLRHGTHNQGRKTHCPARHPYDATNTRVRRDGSRACRQCGRDRQERRMMRAADVPTAV